MRTLKIIIPVLNQHQVTLECLKQLEVNSKTNPTVIILDNGSDQPFSDWLEKHYGLPFTAFDLHIEYQKQITGVWPTFQQGIQTVNYLDSTDQQCILAYLHNDLMIAEDGWDERVIQAFEQDSNLGLVGFVGSNEQDWDGGRGLGTVSNFQGNTYAIGKGSPAEAHGRRIPSLEPAFIEDGCSMIFSMQALTEALLGHEDFPPHHFYDRFLSLRMAQLGYHTATLGIGCDHISGQTANTQERWQQFALDWCRDNDVMVIEGDTGDHCVYLEAERRFLTALHAYMQEHNFGAKIVVGKDYELTRGRDW